jgi:predicted ATPase
MAQALPYWDKAGQHAMQRSAYVEAISHLTRGLELLATLPDTPEHRQHELTLLLALGNSLVVTKGHTAPEAERTYARARMLCQHIGATAQLFPVLVGLWRFYLLRGELQTARELGQQLLRLTVSTSDPLPRMAAYQVLGATLFFLGELVPARAHLEQSMALDSPEQRRTRPLFYGTNPGVHTLSYASWVLWWLGYPEQALQRSHEAVRLARELSHPYSLVTALNWSSRVQQLCRDAPATYAQAEEMLALATEQGFTLWLALGMHIRGWALAAQGRVAEGIAHMQQGLAEHQAMGARLLRPYYLAQLAEVQAEAGQLPEALQVLEEAMAALQHGEERHIVAELYRLKGELLLRESADQNAAAAAASLQHALTIARHQQARSLELRAALSLGRLWQRQGQGAAARALLRPIYAWFTEGFHTADLLQARALLDTLSS